MTSLTQSPVSFSIRSASDLLRSSANGINGVPLKTLGRARFGTSRRRDLVISAKIKKGKKHDYPWPDEIDPNVKSGLVSYLSHFKPLKEQPKLATLEFEKPLMALQKKITDVRKMAADTGLDFSDQINSLESKYQQALKDLYKHLTPHQRLTLARHPNRPTCLDHVISITDQWVELHGDRAGYDDPAIVTGIGRIDGVSYMFIGQQKGRNTKENIDRNFAMPTPHGYRKALRMMLYADHHGFPIITFIDTPGALADLKSEELGQGEAIAYNLRTMFGLKVPIISVVIGEGGSGGALAIGCANKLLILENAVFYVASPEACAAILWKDSKASPRAAECLRITASDLQRLKIVDGIIPEPVGGAHNDPTWTSQQIKMAILDSMEELSAMDITQLLEHRRLKFRNLGEVIEGVQIDPAKKINMRRDVVPANQMEEPDSSSDLGLDDQIEKLKDQILKVKESSSPKPILGLNEMIEKLKKEVDQEFLEAVNSMGFKDRLDMLREEVTKARSSTDQLIDTGLKDQIEKLGQEFKQGLSQAPNIDSLNYKLNMLKELSKAKKISEQGEKVERLKQEINKGFAEVLSRSDLKEKIMKLNEEIKNLDVSTGQDLDPELMEKIKTAKQEIECEMVGALKSLNLEVEVVAPKEEASEGGEFEEQKISDELKAKIEEFDKEINEEIERAVNSSDLKNMIETLKMEEAKAGLLSDPDSKYKIEQMKETIKRRIAEALSSSGLMEKYEKLKQESAAVLINKGD